MIPVATFAGKRGAVFGLGGSGRATAAALVAGGARVSAWDDNATAVEAAQASGIPIEDLRRADWHDFVALVLSPGVPLTHPEPHWSVRKAEEARVEIRNLRREAHDAIKKEEKEGLLGTDAAHRELESLQRVTDRHVADVDKVGSQKEQEVLEV